MSQRAGHQSTSSTNEFFLECKAAFLCLYDDIDDAIESRKRLHSLLQQSGRNPSKAKLDKYWPPGTERLKFDDYVDICRQEPITSADDLMKAFRKIDLNGDGYITLDELYKIMNAQGESMSRDEVKKMIDDVDDNKDGRLDYREFTNMIMKTTEDSKKFSKKVMEKKERRKKREAEKAHSERTSSGGKQSSADEKLVAYKEEPKLELVKPRRDSVKSTTAPTTENSEDRQRRDSSSSKDKDTGLNRSSRKSSIASAKEVSTLERNDISATEPKQNDIRNDKPPRPETPRQRLEMGSQKSLKSESGGRVNKGDNLAASNLEDHPGTSIDSARSVGEQIEIEEDDDIIVSSRTPRINLTSSGSGLTPKPDTLTGDKGNKKDDVELGSQASLRSGDLNAPVPSPRKSVSRLPSEEEVPKATPRVIKREQTVKGKAPSKLLDPKTLRDWSHSSSKGCYFYEEDEIQTHVFTLSLKRDSAVYLTAQPIKEPECVSLPGSEPVDTLLLVFDNQGRLAHWSDARDTRGLYGLSCELTAGVYTVLPYTTGCRFRQRNADLQGSMKEAKLVKVVGDKVQITTKFRQALEDIFELCDLDSNGTMSRDEFNWFNLRTSGEELGQDEWEVVEERTKLEGGEITKQGFIELNEMEAEDAQGDVEDLWITLTSMGMNKALIMDEVCPYKVECYVETGSSFFKVTGIESLHKPEYVTEICKYTIDKAGEPEKIKNMKDLYMYTFKNEHRATIIIDNKSRSLVQMEVDCSRSKNVESNRPSLSCALDIDPQDTVIAHHLIPRSELNDWTVSCTEKILK